MAKIVKTICDCKEGGLYNMSSCNTTPTCCGGGDVVVTVNNAEAAGSGSSGSGTTGDATVDMTPVTNAVKALENTNDGNADDIMKTIRDELAKVTAAVDNIDVNVTTAGGGGSTTVDTSALEAAIAKLEATNDANDTETQGGINTARDAIVDAINDLNGSIGMLGGGGSGGTTYVPMDERGAQYYYDSAADASNNGKNPTHAVSSSASGCTVTFYEGTGRVVSGDVAQGTIPSDGQGILYLDADRQYDTNKIRGGFYVYGDTPDAKFQITWSTSIGE